MSPYRNHPLTSLSALVGQLQFTCTHFFVLLLCVTHVRLYSLLTDREPDVNVSLYSGVPATENSFEYTVLEGQIFGLECRTQPQFSVMWNDTNGVPGQPLILPIILVRDSHVWCVL